MSTVTRQIQTSKTLKLKSVTEDVTFDVPSGKHVILPARTDFSACASALNAQVDLSSKQDANAHLDEISALSGAEGQVLKFNGAGEIVAGTDNEGAATLTFNAPLSESGGEVSFDDTGFLKSADIGVSVQAYSADLLTNSDIGVSVQAYDATILKSSDIGSSVQAYSADILTNNDIGVSVQGYDASTLKSADIGVSVQAYDAATLKSSDIGSSVQGFDSSLLRSSDIGTSVQGYDATILKSVDINDTVQAYNSKLNQLSSLNPNPQDIFYWNGDSVDRASKESLGLQSSITFAQPMSVLEGEVSLHPKLKKIYDLSYEHGDFLRWFDSGGTTEWSKRSSAQVLDDINAQARHPRLTSISQLAGTENKYLRIGSDGNVVEADGSGNYTFNAPLSESGGEVDLDDSNYAKKDSDNAFAGVIQMQLSGSSSYSYSKVFDATSNNTDEFSLVNIPVDPAMVHNVKCDIVAVGHNGASTIRRLTCCVFNSNGGLTQSDEFGDAGLFPIDLGKCEFNISTSGNFLRVRVQGVSGLNIRYHAKLDISSVAGISP
jgi:hypothetical protein